MSEREGNGRRQGGEREREMGKERREERKKKKGEEERGRRERLSLRGQGATLASAHTSLPPASAFSRLHLPQPTHPSLQETETQPPPTPPPHAPSPNFPPQGSRTNFPPAGVSYSQLALCTIQPPRVRFALARRVFGSGGGATYPGKGREGRLFLRGGGWESGGKEAGR